MECGYPCTQLSGHRGQHGQDRGDGGGDVGGGWVLHTMNMTKIIRTGL